MDIKRLKYQKKSKSFPPKTKRHCKICDKKTLWEYNPHTGHSQCNECGYRNISGNLINYEGKVMEKQSAKETNKSNKEYHIYQYLLKLKNKRVRCTLTNSNTIEGTLTYVNQYEIVMTVENKKVVIFKHGIIMIEEIEENLEE